jgi:hypothetical protein
MYSYQENSHYIPLASVLPSNIRYNSSISNFAKILYSEIYLYRQYGDICRLTNKQFCELFGVTENTITTTISQLVSTNLIQRNIIYNADKSVKCRELILVGV